MIIIQAVIRATDCVIKFKMTCQIFDVNKIRFKIKGLVVTLIYMCINKN